MDIETTLFGKDNPAVLEMGRPTGDFSRPCCARIHAGRLAAEKNLRSTRDCVCEVCQAAGARGDAG